MGKLIKYRKRDNKWRVWTTISDGWLTNWLTDAELKEYLAEDYQHDYKLKVIEAYWTFPHGYTDKDSHKRHTDYQAVVAYTDWHLSALKSGNYKALVDEKYTELTGREMI